MYIDPKTSLLSEVEFIASPNCDQRPERMAIDSIIIHGISLPPGEFGGQGIIQLFTNTLNPSDHPYYQQISTLHVSAHLLIRRDGTIIQFVPFDKRAWHAGTSSLEGRINCNDFSIGIELEGTDALPYAIIQYQLLARVIVVLCRTYPAITQGRIVGHSDVAPGRKTDPGVGFDWNYLWKLL